MKRIWNDRSRSKPVGLDRPEVREGPERSGDAAVERADGEGEELRRARCARRHGRCRLHVAHRHPAPPDAAAREVRGDGGERRDDEEREPVAARPGDERSTPATRSGGAVMTPEALSFENQPTLVKSQTTKNCAAERGDDEVEAADAQARQAEERARERRRRDLRRGTLASSGVPGTAAWTS